MNIEDFNLLSEFDKYDIVFTKGTFCAYKLRGNIKLIFYTLFDFYVMLEYNVVKNKILSRSSFKSRICF